MPSPSQVADFGPGPGPGCVAVHDERASGTRAWLRRARPSLGTIVEISVNDRRRDSLLHCALDAAFTEVERVHALMSFQAPNSELSRLNRDAAAGPQQVDSHTYAVFQAALQMAALSGGAFNPCIAPRLEACRTKCGCGTRRRPQLQRIPRSCAMPRSQHQPAIFRAARA